MRRPWQSLITMLAFVALAAPALAQLQTGSILVRVTDENGAVLPGVTLTIASPNLVAAMTGSTDAGGAYRVPGLPPGTYSVKFELSGFQTTLREKVAVNVGATTPIDMSLKVASREEQLTVTAESPVVDTTSANINVTLDSQLLQSAVGGRDIWALVESKVPGLVTTRPDVGGSAGGLQGGMVAHGTPNSQNTQMLNGINIGDPAAIGFAGFYYDYDAFEQIQVSTGSHDMSSPSSGVVLNMVTKTGGDRWSGRVFGAWQGDATQGQNVDQELQEAGLAKNAGATEFVSDFTASVGGPLIRDKLRFFGSLRDWRVHVNVAGFPEVENTDMTSGLANLTWQVNQTHRVTGFFARQSYDKPNRGASPNVTPESNNKEDDFFTILQGQWNSVLGQNTFIDGRVSYLKIFFPLYQKGNDQSLNDLSINLLSRAAAQEQIFNRKRLQASLNLQHFVASALGGRHELRFGLDYSHTPTTTAIHRIDDLTLSYRSQPTQTPVSVTFHNSPVDSKQTVDVMAVFAQDSYSVKNLTFNLGARYEHVQGYLPEQSSAPSRWFSNLTRSFAAIHDIPKWDSIAPRASLVYDIGGKGKSAVRAAAGRYYYVIGTGTPNAVNPNFNSSETYAWNDLNRDLRYQDGERGAFQSRAGSLFTSYDPNLKRPYTDEFSLGFDHELIPNLKLSISAVRRMERSVYGNIDEGIPFSFYTPVNRVDIGRDGLAGTADDTTIQVYDQTTPGASRVVIRNDDRLNTDYKGLEITATKRFSKRWQGLIGYTIGKAESKAGGGVGPATGAATNIQTPNQLINAEGPINEDREHIFKLSGQVELPWSLYLAPNVQVFTGAPVTRTANFALTQGNVSVNVEPRGSVRLDTKSQIDMRLARTFKLGGSKAFEAAIDGYNLTNSAYVWEVRTLTGRFNAPVGGTTVQGGTGESINQQQFLLPSQIIGPRIFRFSGSFRF